MRRPCDGHLHTGCGIETTAARGVTLRFPLPSRIQEVFLICAWSTGFIGRGWYPVNGANLPRLQCAEVEFQLICRFRPGGNRNAAIRHCTARQVEKSKRLAQGTDRICDRFFMRAPVDFRVASALTRLINAVSFWALATASVQAPRSGQSSTIPENSLI